MNLHIFKASGRLVPLESEIISAFNEVSEKIAGKLQLPEIDVLVADYPDMVTPETGMVGYAITPNLLYLYINPESENFKTQVNKVVTSTLAHELHHCTRIHAIGYGKTLLEAMVSEGLRITSI